MQQCKTHGHIVMCSEHSERNQPDRTEVEPPNAAEKVESGHFLKQIVESLK